MNKIFALFLVILTITLSCSKDTEPVPESNCYTLVNPPNNSNKASIKQGVWGDIWFWSGDFSPVGLGEICQVKRQVYVYELTTLGDVEKIDTSSFYSAINSKLVTIVESDNEGFFQTTLEPGIYSLFVKEDDRFYSNRFDTNGVFTVNIELDKVNAERFDITYEAIY